MRISKFDDSRIISFSRFLLQSQPQAGPFCCPSTSSYVEVVVVLFGMARASRLDLLGWCADRHFDGWSLFFFYNSLLKSIARSFMTNDQSS